MSKILVTGSAGFIGFHVCRRLLESGHRVAGFDNLSPFYDEGLKAARLGILKACPAFEFIRGDLTDLDAVQQLFRAHQPDYVVHLAAQPGVRYSLENPEPYVQSNLVGFVNLIEEARKNGLRHFVFASSSSVYGANTKVPFREDDRTDRPISLYAATKKSNELIGHVYAHLYHLPVTGLRLFTVYGPWGRPDMALFKFCKAIFAGAPITVYNHGHMLRDFTYIDDAVESIVLTLEKPPQSPSSDREEAAAAPYRLCNVGNHRPVELAMLIAVLEKEIGKKATIEWLPMQAGDMPDTCADVEELSRLLGYCPHTPIEQGVHRFVEWFREYYKP
jgi:UDP-glucuronate 4-epimerase